MNRIALVVFLWVLLTSGVEAQEAARQRVKIGAILPMTGAIASVGEAMQRGLTMAVSDTKHISVQIIVEDDQTANRVKAVSAANKLVSVDKVEIVFNAVASTVSAFSSVLKAANVPCLVLWDSNRTLHQLGPQIIGFGYENELAGEDMASFVTQRLGHKKVGIINFHDDWSEVITQAFETRFKALGGSIVLREQVNGDTTDFRTIVTRLKSSGAAAVYLPLFGPGLQAAIKQARSVKFEGDLLTADSFIDSDIAGTKGAAEGMYLTQIWFENSEFMNKYQATFGSAKISGTNLGYAALAYDAIMLVDAIAGEMIQNHERITSSSLLNKLPKFSFEGVLGPAKIEASNSVVRRERILQVRNDSFASLP
jgi:branched-chain amino acid transport system substrate-binding protein